MEEVRLGTLTNRKIGYGIVQPGASVPHGIPVIKVNNIISGLRNVRDLDTTSIGNDKKYSRTKLKGGELIVSVVGTIGRTAIVPMNFAGCNLVRATALIDIPDVQMSKWVKYYIDSPKGQNYIRENLNTTVQPTLNVKSLVEMPIPVYSTQYMQKAIEILGNIDDKIEVNRRINDNFYFAFFEVMLIWALTTLRNDNLEQQAQALFKSWFVDFEPFRDQPFVESELGMIPEGWRVGTIGELLEIKYGKDHKKLSDGEIPVYGSGGLMRKCECALYDGESVLIPRKGTLNNVMYVNEAFWTVDTMFYSIPIIDNVVLFTYLYLSGKDLASMNSGSAVPSMTTEILNNMLIVIPTEMVIRDFNITVTSIYSRIKHGNEESRRLAQLRDTLLPRLMSGELRVNEIENEI